MLTAEEIATLQSELETLRKTNAELVSKHQKSKARIAELETSVTALETKMTETQTALHDATVGAPLKTMSEDVSPVPELFREQFSKFFKLEMVNEALTLLSIDGKAVTGKDSKPVPFERMALTKFLTEGEDARAKTFQLITRTNWASGAQPTTEPIHRPVAQAKQPVTFGLR